ncbi:MAG: EamA family transporter RarD [Oscillospiraceae bacterium]|jgi:chloramphenicol-sensitive protein RarD|nr:EamA family transporter RarD [Oscillospiraceae bacterium]
MNRSSLNVLGCYILWGLLPIFWKLLAGVNSAYVLAQRIVFSCVFCLAVILIRKNGGEIGKIIKNKSERRKFFLCGILISINWGVYILTVAMGRILEASLAYYMNPLFSVLIGAIFFKERLSRVQWASVALAFAGVMFSVIRYGEVPYLAIIIGLSFALYGALKKGIKADSETSICMETMAVLPIALVFIAYAQFSGFTTFSSLTTAEALLLIATGPITSIPLMLFAKGIKETSIVTSGILMYINPTLQLLVGVFIYNEAFTQTNAITFAFVWTAVILFVFDSLRKHKKVNA